MKTLLKNSKTCFFKNNSLLLILFTLVSFTSCKKETAQETKEEKIRKAMIAAGFTPVSDTEIPKGIVPYNLSNEEIDNLINGVKSQSKAVVNPKSNETLANAQKNLLIIKLNNSNLTADVGDEGEFGSKIFFGTVQFYQFMNLQVNVSVTFDKTKKNGGWIWKMSAHTVGIHAVEDSSTFYSTYTETGNSGSYEDTDCDFTSTGSLYVKAGGSTFTSTKTINGNSEANGPFIVSIS